VVDQPGTDIASRTLHMHNFVQAHICHAAMSTNDAEHGWGRMATFASVDGRSSTVLTPGDGNSAHRAWFWLIPPCVKFWILIDPLYFTSHPAAKVPFERMVPLKPPVASRFLPNLQHDTAEILDRTREKYHVHVYRQAHNKSRRQHKGPSDRTDQWILLQ